MLECPQCGKLFAKDPKHINKVYCSLACRKAHDRQKAKLARRIMTYCDCCGKEFEAENKLQRFCSDECKVNYSKPKSSFVECSFCGTLFDRSATRRRVFCSDHCREKYFSSVYVARRAGRDFVPPQSKRKKPKGETLQQAAANARKMGMSYGQYVLWKQSKGGFA